jgi:hypothetical protein
VGPHGQHKSVRDPESPDIFSPIHLYARQSICKQAEVVFCAYLAASCGRRIAATPINILQQSPFSPQVDYPSICGEGIKTLIFCAVSPKSPIFLVAE